MPRSAHLSQRLVSAGGGRGLFPLPASGEGAHTWEPDGGLRSGAGFSPQAKPTYTAQDEGAGGQRTPQACGPEARVEPVVPGMVLRAPRVSGVAVGARGRVG